MNDGFQNCKYFQNRLVEALSRSRDPNMTQNEHVCAICCQPEVAGDGVSGENVKTIDRYALLDFEAAIVRSFRENQNHQFQ